MEKAFQSAANATADERLIAKMTPGDRSANGTLDGRFLTWWAPYAIAACLMILGISQVRQIMALKSHLLAARTDATRLRESNALTRLRLMTLPARDASYASTQIVVAWDPYRHEGVIALENLPAAPAGRDYQLWVLDPAAEAPISAGLLTTSRPFTMQPVSTPSPGFAISLEPGGGSPEPTTPILFAVAPGP
jgi:anti-sigma-K factor RskA